MPSLDQLVSRARSARVADEDARAYVATLGRLAPRHEPRRGMPWWLGGALGLVAAAAVIALIVGRRDSSPVATAPVRIGPRVAVVPGAGAIYRVTAADARHTEIEVERGTVSARLFHGAGDHELTLGGGGVRARAVGTVYALTVDGGRGTVEVIEGTVRVEHDGATDAIAAGSAWPAGAARRANGAALLALAPTDVAGIVPADTNLGSNGSAVGATGSGGTGSSTGSDTGSDRTIVGSSTGSGPAAGSSTGSDRTVVGPRIGSAGSAGGSSAPSVTDRWRRARLLRAQGDFAGAIADCLAIADARDATWAPIALLEAARIELGPRASPERAIAIAERFEREWSSHQLAPEAREVRCRALRQLGRGC